MTEPLNVVVLVSGSGTLLQAILDAPNPRYRVIHVVADKECTALQRAAAHGVPSTVVAMNEDRSVWDKELKCVVDKLNPDVVVSAGFMRILGPAFLESFEGRTINTHPALLPAFPGAHGVRDALDYGVKVTGSTVHYVDSGVDTGRIIAQEPVLVANADDEDSLHEKIKRVERRLIVDVLNRAHVDSTTRKVTF